jgi:hypothetical protein
MAQITLREETAVFPILVSEEHLRDMNVNLFVCTVDQLYPCPTFWPRYAVQSMAWLTPS